MAPLTVNPPSVSELVRSTPPDVSDGTFLIRERDASGGEEFVMCVVFRKAPTHHLMKRNDEGLFTINKASYGDFKTLEDVRAGDLVQRPLLLRGRLMLSGIASPFG